MSFTHLPAVKRRDAGLKIAVYAYSSGIYRIRVNTMAQVSHGSLIVRNEECPDARRQPPPTFYLSA
ncbi:hypothetical protein ACRALDRAFT_2032619, partial [Sodiomyces alcalophilus JCM 7366]|uniref:uncharacterized protein n=1 Tax=Sodiomyces alcalophilus JCM 7366 TaxID=591952 RepID=UPI0039B63039